MVPWAGFEILAGETKACQHGDGISRAIHREDRNREPPRGRSLPRVGFWRGTIKGFERLIDVR